MTTSPTRPIAWLSDEMIENAPRSWRMSSAAIVSLRMRLSAKATSSGIVGSRWWQTISMSRCSSIVLTREGPRRVGRGRDDVRQAARRLMMSGAWPPPAPSVWKAWIVRPLNAAIVSSTKPVSLSVSVWISDLHVHLVGDRQAAVDRGRRRAPVLVQLERRRRRPRSARPAPRAGCALPLPRKPRFIGKASAACSMRRDVPGAGRAGGGVGAGRRARAAAEHRRDAANRAPPRSAAGR